MEFREVVAAVAEEEEEEVEVGVVACQTAANSFAIRSLVSGYRREPIAISVVAILVRSLQAIAMSAQAPHTQVVTEAIAMMEKTMDVT